MKESNRKESKFAPRRTTLLASAIAAIALGSLMPVVQVNASDHIDSPTLAHDKASDLNDTYAFLDPNDNSKVVLMMTINPFLISGEIIGQAIFDHNIRYRFEIENTGDARPDRFVDVQFSPGLGRLTPQTATIRLPNGQGFRAPVTVAPQGNTPPPFRVTNHAPSGASFYAGATDDPFFLDNTAANRFVLSSLDAIPGANRSVFTERAGPDRIGRDTYAGFNTLAIAVSVPATMLQGSGDVIGINSVTQRRANQLVTENGTVVSAGGPFRTLDRDGGPLVNNGLIPARLKNAYNSAPTTDDANGRFRANIIQSLRNFGTNPTFINKILAAAVDNGDILRLDLTVPNFGTGGGTNTSGGFGNLGGRRLADDVADDIFTLVNNGQPLTDFVDGNDAPFTNVFPFFALPIQPNPLGVDNVDDRTRQ